MQYAVALATSPLAIGSLMTVVYVSLLLLGIGLLLHLVGKFWIAYYGFKYSAGMGIAVLFVPLFTLYFAFFKLEKEGKEKAIMLWIGGVVLALVTFGGFFGPVMDGLTGRAFASDYMQPKYLPVPTPKPKPKPATPAPTEGATPDDDGAPADGAAADGAPADGAAADGAPADGAAGEGAPADGAAGGDAPADAAPADGAPTDDAAAAPAEGAPAAPAGDAP